MVTINADTPQQAVAALVYFYTHHFACETKMMTAKQPYIMSKKNQEEFDKLFKHLSYKEGFIVLKRYLKDLGTVVPTLFKQYIELYEEGAVRYFDFSVNDGLFGVTEGFIISDNYRMKKSIQERNLKEFNKIKNIDKLTQLHSRIYFQEKLCNIIKYKRKSDRVFSIISISIISVYEDIQTNDTALIKVASLLKKSLREDDIIAKWGNKEFIVLLKHITQAETKGIIQKLNSIFNETKISGKYRLLTSIKELSSQEKDAIINCTHQEPSGKELFVY